ncbi:MAG: Radical protein [Bacteroidota bacterium]|nr:Radical protein [Bacteroidota bacterium]
MIDDLFKRLAECDICPQECKVNRIEGECGKCGTDSRIILSSYGPHYGEEPELVGLSSSGTIFFGGCSLLCKFCQNYEISHCREGSFIDEVALSEIMLHLQSRNCNNINLVTPTHFAPQIIKALVIAKNGGLTLPVVYNSGGYDKVDTLKHFDGLIDIYMPDLKFKNEEFSSLYTMSEKYFEYASQAVIEMHRQVGDLVVKNGVARRGMIIRHLVLPDNQSDTREIIEFIADNLGTNTYLNLMDQYMQSYKAHEFPKINRRLNYNEFKSYIEYAKKLGFKHPVYLYG